MLALQGVEAKLVYPECCGMPQLEAGDLADVAGRARRVAKAFAALIDDGYEIVALTASCGLMMKFEWPLILPDDAEVKRLSQATFDLSEYLVSIARKEGLAPGLSKVEGGVSVHLACHARAQNMGAKGAEMLRLIPETKVTVVERCSGHGGVWGARTENFPIAVKIGRPTAMRAVGLANGCNPVGVIVPCHRVIGASGSLTGYGGGLWRKRWLLHHEGATFRDNVGGLEAQGGASSAQARLLSQSGARAE